MRPARSPDWCRHSASGGVAVDRNLPGGDVRVQVGSLTLRIGDRRLWLESSRWFMPFQWVWEP
jgi:hypothetical protein